MSVIETNCKNNWPSQPSYIFPIQLIFPKTLWIQTTFNWHQHHEGVSKNISALSFAKKHLRVHVHISAVCVWVWWCPHAEGHRRRRHGLQHILSKNFKGSLKTQLRPGCRIYSYDVQCATLPSLCRKGTLLGTWTVFKKIKCKIFSLKPWDLLKPTKAACSTRHPHVFRNPLHHGHVQHWCSL